MKEVSDGGDDGLLADEDTTSSRLENGTSTHVALSLALICLVVR